MASSSHPIERGNSPSVQRLVAQFDDLQVSRPPETQFVGGFRDKVQKPLPPTPFGIPLGSIPPSLQPGHGRAPRPTPPATPCVSQSSKPQTVASPMPMPMPTPMPPTPIDRSLTMAYAKAGPDVYQYPPSFPIPQSDRDLAPPYFGHQYHSSVPSSVTSSPLVSPQIATRTRASSTPPSPSSSSGSAGKDPAVQCYGMTKAGKRCNRVVKAPPLVSFFAPIASEPIERFCFQHVREVLGQSGFYSHKERAGWVEFSDWIPRYLHADTQAALRIEMEKPASLKDEPGYIYAYEIRDERMEDDVLIKVGRAVKLAKRLDQWSKQCTSKEVILRGWWPGTVEDDNGTNGTSLLRGRIKAGEKGPLCHRLERLVHLELADLAVHAPYLDPGFFKLDTKANGASAPSAPSTPRRSPKPSKACMPGKACVDCGAVHKEIFTFKRIKTGRYIDKEWERLVQPVIAKWGRFVGEYV